MTARKPKPTPHVVPDAPTIGEHDAEAVGTYVLEVRPAAGADLATEIDEVRALLAAAGWEHRSADLQRLVERQVHCGIVGQGWGHGEGRRRSQAGNAPAGWAALCPHPVQRRWPAPWIGHGHKAASASATS